MAKKEKVIAGAFFVLGATSIGSQIVILRELFGTFCGNELSVAVTLGGWFFLIGAGSLFLGRFADKIKNDTRYFSYLLISLSIGIPLAISLCRFVRQALGLSPGEIADLVIVIGPSLAALCVFCLPYGFLFALGCKIYGRVSESGEDAAGKAFFFESAGAAVGGTVISLILLNRTGPYQIAWFLSALNLACAFIAGRTLSPQKETKAARLAAVLAVLGVCAWALGAFDKTDLLSKRAAWRPFRVIKSESSIYSDITATSHGSQINFYSNGLLIFSFPDRLSAEETVHYAMLSHPETKKILLIGGGLNGAVGEILKYNPEAVDYVELDPILIEMAKEVIGKDIKNQLSAPVLRVIKGDGRFYIKTSEELYDVIIISAPDPHTARINRLYTVEFFREAAKRLEQDGILSISCAASENYIGPEMAEYLNSIHKTLTEAGYSAGIVPGETIRFLARKTGRAPRISAAFFREKLKEKGVDNYFVNGRYLDSKLSAERREYAKKAITGARGASVNSDFRPISYYYNSVLWAAYFQKGLKPVLVFFDKPRVWALILIITALTLIFYLPKLRSRGRPVFIAIATTGFSELAVEINLMLAFQIIYGYLYYKMGFIIASFMAGLFIGSYAMTKKLRRIDRPLALLKKAKLLTALICFAAIALFKLFSENAARWPIGAGANFAFPAFMLLSGIIGGMQFPLANKIILGEKNGIGKTAGALYGADLIGGTLGALLVAAVFIPIIGVFQCLCAAGLINMASAFILRPRVPAGKT